MRLMLFATNLMLCRGTSQSVQAKETPLSSLQLEFVALGVGLRFVELSDAQALRRSFLFLPFLPPGHKLQNPAVAFAFPWGTIVRWVGRKLLFRRGIAG